MTDERVRITAQMLRKRIRDRKYQPRGGVSVEDVLIEIRSLPNNEFYQVLRTVGMVLPENIPGWIRDDNGA